MDISRQGTWLSGVVLVILTLVTSVQGAVENFSGTFYEPGVADFSWPYNDEGYYYQNINLGGYDSDASTVVTYSVTGTPIEEGVTSVFDLAIYHPVEGYVSVLYESEIIEGSDTWTGQTSIDGCGGTIQIRIYDPDNIVAEGSVTVACTVPSPPQPEPCNTFFPSPSDDATDVLIDPVLSWSSGAGAASYRVYIGTDPGSLSLVAEVGDRTFDLSSQDLAPGTTYYWRVDGVRSDNTICPGDVWTFTTKADNGPAWMPPGIGSCRFFDYSGQTRCFNTDAFMCDAAYGGIFNADNVCTDPRFGTEMPCGSYGADHPFFSFTVDVGLSPDQLQVTEGNPMFLNFDQPESPNVSQFDLAYITDCGLISAGGYQGFGAFEIYYHPDTDVFCFTPRLEVFIDQSNFCGTDIGPSYISIDQTVLAAGLYNRALGYLYGNGIVNWHVDIPSLKVPVEVPVAMTGMWLPGTTQIEISCSVICSAPLAQDCLISQLLKPELPGDYEDCAEYVNICKKPIPQRDGFGTKIWCLPSSTCGLAGEDCECKLYSRPKNDADADLEFEADQREKVAYDSSKDYFCICSKED